MQIKKISVIMPVFNGEAYLEKALASFLAQTISSECELICVDDGSTDTSLSLLLKAEAEHPGVIRVIAQENLGSAQARNAALDIAQGEFIAFLDDDDHYPRPTTIEALHFAATNNDVYIAGGSFSIVTGSSKRDDFTGEPGFEGHTFQNEGLVEYRDYQFDYGYQRFIYRRDLIEGNNLRFPDLRRYQDPPFFVRAMLAAVRFYALPETTYCYCSGQRTVNWDRQKMYDQYLGLCEVAQLAEENNLVRLQSTNQRRMLDAYLAITELLSQEQAKSRVLADDMREVEAALADIRGSTSLKVGLAITSPLRAIKDRLKR